MHVSACYVPSRFKKTRVKEVMEVHVPKGAKNGHKLVRLASPRLPRNLLLRTKHC